MRRYLALDVGERTIGIAVSDPLGLTAQGVETIRRDVPGRDLERLEELMQAYGTRALVVGLPRNMNGTEGERCEAVRAFVEDVKKACPGTEAFFQDERLSTRAAARSLIQADVSRKKRKQVIDKMAAVHILQGFLDGMGRGGTAPSPLPGEPGTARD